MCAMNNTTIDIGLKKSLTSKNDLKHSPFWPAINIEFQDIVYSVPDLLGNYTLFLYEFYLHLKKINKILRIHIYKLIQYNSAKIFI